MDFTPREVKMLNILLQGPSTTKELAKNLNVSRRTVLRDIPSVSGKLKPYDITLKTKTGMGISLVGESQNINRLKQKLTVSYMPP
ncbi:MAG TPA: HTH domain-containing protein, partial [Thermoanaerobacterales bacterium]|nr:HTH domain-containing protein [Thermoanaerobacterales bacterium]